MSTLRLAVLGPPQILRDDQAIELNIAKVQALLTYLAVTDVPQTRDHLLALLWAESAPEAARKNLRNRLWQLRQTLGEEVILSTGDKLALAPTIWTDVTRFVTDVQAQLQTQTLAVNQLEQALQLWRGPLLEGVQFNEAPEFEIWLTTERERLGQLYRRGLTALISEWQRVGDWAHAVMLAQRGLTYDPLHEAFHQQLMLAYAQQGARADALRQYDRLHSLLGQELGIEPLPETVALHAAILNNKMNGQGKPAIGSRQWTVASEQWAEDRRQKIVDSGQMSGLNRQSPVAGLQSPVPDHQSPFVGRQAQLAALDLAWQQARRGQCKVVLISGELGIGKTRLWRTWAAQLTPDQVILETRCLNTTQTVPFDPLRRLLSSVQARTHFAQIAAALLPVWRVELLHLSPGLQQGAMLADDQMVGGVAATPAEERGLLAEALIQFLHSFHAQPLVFFLDDLHWADEATLNWLLYLTDRMATEPILLISAYRPEDASPTLARIVTQWQRDGLLQRVPLPHLAPQEAAALLTTLGSNETMVDYLYTQSGGNPYYLTQLSDVAVDGIPAPLADLVQARLSYLPTNLQPILQAAAVLEPAIDVDILRQTSQRSEEEILDAVDGLLAARVLVERAETYEFVHPLVASVVREGLNSSRRKLLHRRAAEGLTARYADQLPTVAGQLARHYSEAGIPSEAARFAEMAGEEALRIGAADEAVAFYQQAYQLEPTPARQLGIGLGLIWLPGKVTEARAAMQQALEASEAQGDCQGAIKAGLRLAASYLATQEGAQVLAWARRVLPDLETVDDIGLHASAHYLMGTAKFRNNYSLSEAAIHYAEATRLATTHHLESDIALMSWFEWGNLYLEQGNYPLAIEKFQQARRVAQGGKSILFEALSLNNLAYATLLTGAVAEARALINTGIKLVETYALRSAQQYFYSTRGEIALAAGALDEATTSFQQALALAEKYANPTFAANVRAHLGRVAQARGEFDEALTLLTAAQAAVQGNTAHYLQTQIDLWLAEVYLARGERAAAENSVRLAEARLVNGQHYALQEWVLMLRHQLAQV
ncbi:MAG: BTAD domain-containing putative transcriptional regulator [Caldilineaceae bacterium]